MARRLTKKMKREAAARNQSQQNNNEVDIFDLFEDKPSGNQKQEPKLDDEEDAFNLF